MLNTFANADVQLERRLDRERHMARMEELASEYVWDENEINLAPVGRPPVDSYPRQGLISAVWQQCLRRRYFLAASLCLLALAATVLGFCLGIKAGEGKVSTLGTTTFSELTPEQRQHRRYEHLLSIIIDFGVTSHETLKDNTTAQARALEWIAFQDTQTLVQAEVLRTRYALATLFFSTQSVESSYGERAHWYQQTHWLSSYPVCLWHGVQCHDEESTLERVLSLNLTANGLVGTLAPEIGLLQLDILSLDLSYNNIEGTIPTELSSLLNLKELYLGPNHLNGTLISTLGELRHLTHLYLNDCSLTGNIPLSIGRLTKLEGLGLHDNLLTGTIPETLGNLENLLALYLDDNRINGTIPISLGSLSSLVDLRLRKNKITGPIPELFNQLTSLQILYLDSNELLGTLSPALVASWRLLRELHLYKNQFSGMLPEELGTLVLLRVLYLDNNQIFGPIPSGLANLHHLESLYLFHNKLSGSIPYQFGEMRNLEHLRLNTNSLSGTLPPEISNLPHLETLLLHNNDLEGTVPPEWGDLSSLEKLHLHGNTRINGTMPFAVCLLNERDLDDLTADCDGDDSNTSLIDCQCCTECY